MTSPASETLTTAIRLHQAGRLDEAEALYRAALEDSPDDAGAWHLLGVVSHQRGRDGEAVELIARAIAIDPHQGTFHGNLGVALRSLGRLDEAESALRQALRLLPDFADAHSNLALVFHQKGELALARAGFEAALRIQPEHADALFNLGNLMLEIGRAGEAVGFHQRAHRAAPGRADVLNNLGGALLAADRDDEAAAAFRSVIEADPTRIDARLNLATFLERHDRHAEAIACLDAAVRLRPADRRIALRRAATCPAVFPDSESIARYRAELAGVLESFRGAGLAWDADDITAAGCYPSFNLAHHGDDDRALRAAFAAVYREPAPRPRPPHRTHPGPPRIGFVVTHPHEGSFLRCNAGLLSRITPGRFAIHVFGSVHGIEVLRRAIHHPDIRFVAFPDRPKPAAERIAAAGCDLLHYWEVGTDALNYALPFARPAPVQAAGWGVQVTTGVQAIDYYVSSDLVESDGADAHYTETLVRLPCLLSYQERAPRPDPPPTRAEFGLPDSASLYACLQRPLKLHPRFDELIAGILRRDERGVVVLLKGPNGTAAEQIMTRHRAVMPDVADRIIWLPFQKRAAYLRALALADAVLDPVPHGAGSSAYDAFSLDQPVVTSPGEHNAGRYVLACYRRMGITDLVAATAEEYAEIAVRLGTDPDHHRAMRTRIARSSPVLFDDIGVVREHERFFEWAIAAGREG